MRSWCFVIAVGVFMPPVVARTQEFSKVVINPSTSGNPREFRLRMLPNGHLIGHSVFVGQLISIAYAVPLNPSPRLVALPEWAFHESFDLTAETSSSLEMDKMNEQTQRRTIQLLLQELLRTRFGLVLKVRTVTTPVYELRLSNGTQKLQRSKVRPSDCILDVGADECHSFAIGFGHPLNTKAADMFDLAAYLENWTDLPVVDRTETNGLFEMHSEGWRPIKLPPPPPGVSANGSEFNNLSTLSLVLARFGLEVHRTEDKVPFYTVERLNRPSAG